MLTLKPIWESIIVKNLYYNSYCDWEVVAISITSEFLHKKFGIEIEYKIRIDIRAIFN